MGRHCIVKIKTQIKDRMSSTFRKKLNHFERETIDASGKLRIMEPQIEKQEAEIERSVPGVGNFRESNWDLGFIFKIWDLGFILEV